MFYGSLIYRYQIFNYYIRPRLLKIYRKLALVAEAVCNRCEGRFIGTESIPDNETQASPAIF